MSFCLVCGNEAMQHSCWTLWILWLIRCFHHFAGRMQITGLSNCPLQALYVFVVVSMPCIKAFDFTPALVVSISSFDLHHVQLFPQILRFPVHLTYELSHGTHYLQHLHYSRLFRSDDSLLLFLKFTLCSLKVIIQPVSVSSKPYHFQS